MKKGFSLLFLSALITSSMMIFSGCNKGDTRVQIHFGEYVGEEISNITNLPKLTYNDLSSKILNQETFMLAIYGEETCGCWSDYQPVLTEYVNDTHQKIDYISSYDFIGRENTFGLYLVTSDLPSLAVFEQGQLKIQSVYLRDDRLMFKSYTKFKEFVDKNVILPKMLYVEKDELDSLIAEDKEFNLYVARSACGDCNAVKNDVLYDWSKNTKDVSDILYVFDIQEYYAGVNASDDAKATYQEIKDYYGLSDKNNPTFGYSTGMVPTFQRRKGMEILDMIVVLNDTVDSSGETKKLSSYFTKARANNIKCLKNSGIQSVLDGMDLSSDLYDEKEFNGTTYFILNDKFRQTYHYPIVREFFKAYVK